MFILFISFICLILTFLFGLGIIGFIEGFNFERTEDIPGDSSWIDRR